MKAIRSVDAFNDVIPNRSKPTWGLAQPVGDRQPGREDEGAIVSETVRTTE